MILSQYKCVSNAVSGGTCIGGVDDLLAAGVRNLRTMTKIQVCRYKYILRKKQLNGIKVILILFHLRK